MRCPANGRGYDGVVSMKKLIGGLFQTQEDANQAYEALKRSGFADEAVNTFVHKPGQQTARATDVRIQDIAKNAFIGGLIGATLGALIGFLVGSGELSHPYLEPGSAPREPLFVFMSFVWGVIPGGLIGVILGAASKLFRSQEKAEVMTRQIDKRGVLVTVSVDDEQSETRARRVMEEGRAVEVGNPAEKWDLDAWFSPNETNPSLRNLANTR